MEEFGLRLSAHIEKTRIPVTIDIGFGDALADPEENFAYQRCLNFPLQKYAPIPRQR